MISSSSFKSKGQNVITYCIQFKALEPQNRARGNRKTSKRPKMMSKINFRNLKLKSHEEYLLLSKRFDIQARRQS